MAHFAAIDYKDTSKEILTFSRMPLRYIVPLLAISIAFCRCANDTTKLLPPIPRECGEVTALKNGQPWPGIVRGASWWENSGKLRLKFRVYSEEGYLRETLDINNVVPIIEEKQKVHGYNLGNHQGNVTLYAIHGLFFADGDAHGGSYYSIDSTNGFIKLDSISKQMVWGKFDSLTLYPPISNFWLTDTFRFTQGTFEACILD